MTSGHPDLDQLSEPRRLVAAVARLLSRAGLVEAFGHISCRVDGGFLITTTAPLHSATSDDVLLVGADGTPRAGPREAAPLEIPMHAAIYQTRGDVNAICRGHPPHAVEWGVGTEDLPLLHGLGAIAGPHVGVHDDIELITDLDRGRRVAESLGDDMALLLRANGALAVGADPIEAATRLYFLDERARVALRSPATGAADERWAPRLQHTAPELRRAVAWFRTRFSEQ